MRIKIFPITDWQKNWSLEYKTILEPRDESSSWPRAPDQSYANKITLYYSSCGRDIFGKLKKKKSKNKINLSLAYDITIVSEPWAPRNQKFVFPRIVSAVTIQIYEVKVKGHSK